MKGFLITQIVYQLIVLILMAYCLAFEDKTTRARIISLVSSTIALTFGVWALICLIKL